MDLCGLRPAWSTPWVLGHPEMFNMALSKKKALKVSSNISRIRYDLIFSSFILFHIINPASFFPINYPHKSKPKISLCESFPHSLTWSFFLRDLSSKPFIYRDAATVMKAWDLTWPKENAGPEILNFSWQRTAYFFYYDKSYKNATPRFPVALGASSRKTSEGWANGATITLEFCLQNARSRHAFL